MVDYHIHSDYSQDAEGSIIDYCRQAQLLGLTEICFTQHFEIDPMRRAKDDKVRLAGKWVGMMSDWIEHYRATVERARKEFAPMKIGFGLEVGYDPGIELEIEQFLKRYPFDFVLGSIHCIDHIAITAHDPDDFYYSQTTPEQATERYFYLLHRLIASGLFDAIGHIDVFKRYSLSVFGTRLSELAEPLWHEVFRQIVQHPPLTIEINTAGLRHDCRETYPSENILKMAQAAGLEYVTLGSDAHRLQHLGCGLEEGTRLVRRFGLRVARYERRQPCGEDY